VFGVDPSDFKTILITYVQDDTIVLEKHKNDLIIIEVGDVYEASLRLTQEETKLFNSQSSVKVQVRALTYNGDALASEKMTVNVFSVLNDEVLT
jgi:hypothetical protein